MVKMHFVFMNDLAKRSEFSLRDTAVVPNARARNSPSTYANGTPANPLAPPPVSAGTFIPTLLLLPPEAASLPEVPVAGFDEEWRTVAHT